MTDIFNVKIPQRLPRDKCKVKLGPNCNQITFGAKSINVFGSKIWNSLPYPTKNFGNIWNYNKKLGWGFV